MNIWVKVSGGDLHGQIVTLGGGQKARKAQEGVSYEIIGEGEFPRCQDDRAGDARLHAGYGKVQGDASGKELGVRGKPVGSEHSHETLARVGKKVGRPAKR